MRKQRDPARPARPSETSETRQNQQNPDNSGQPARATMSATSANAHRVQRVISFDCAVVNMGVTCIDITPVNLPACPRTNPSDLPGSVLALTEYFHELDRQARQLVNITYAQVWSLASTGRQVDIHSVARTLRPMLDEIEQSHGPFDVVMYENQMPQNDKSRTVAHFIAYHFCDRRVVRVPPVLKNQLVPAPGLALSDHAAVQKTSYLANKAHSVAVLEHWMRVMGVNLVLPRKRDDIADSFTQVLGYIQRESRATPVSTPHAPPIAKKKSRTRHYAL